MLGLIYPKFPFKNATRLSCKQSLIYFCNKSLIQLHFFNIIIQRGIGNNNSQKKIKKKVVGISNIVAQYNIEEIDIIENKYDKRTGGEGKERQKDHHESGNVKKLAMMIMQF
jgi:hypothetical protein